MEKNSNKKKIILISLILIIAICISIIICITNINKQNTKSVVSNNQKQNLEVNEKIEQVEDKDNIKDENYTDAYKEYLELSDEEKAKIDVIPRQEKIEYGKIEKIIKEQGGLNLENLPEKFDLREVIDIKVENQESLGLCWAFSSLTCLETNLALTQNKYYDLSEIHMYYSMMKDGSEDDEEGANFGQFKNYSRYGGFALQDELEYREYDYEEYKNFNKISLIEESVVKTVDFPSYCAKEEKWSEEKFERYQSAIKNHIMNFGSLYAAITNPSNTDENNFYVSDVDEKIDENSHAISIIGWDDNYPKENFMSDNGNVPENDGAYVFLNSWGKDFGEDGYGYISYEDYFVHMEMSGVISTSEKDLINLSENNNPELMNFIENKYKKYIIEKNNNKYIAPIALETYIHELDLSGIGLKTLKGIELFDSVIDLNLSNNELTSVEELKTFYNINTLNISNNQIEDISCLEEVKGELFHLSASNNIGLTGYEKLDELVFLEIRNCGITDISKLSNLKNLDTLELSENNIEKGVETLKNLKKLVGLKLENCNIKDINWISDMRNLNSLDLSKNKMINDFKCLEKCENLCFLELRECAIKNAEKLPFNIEVLDLSGNTEISNINKLKNVESLSLNNCNIKDFNEILELQQLIDLSLENNNLGNISELAKLDNLISLNLSGNESICGDLSNSSIVNLTLNNCNLDSKFDFFGIKGLEYLGFKGNNMTIDEIIEKDCQIDMIQWVENLKVEDMNKMNYLECKVIDNIKIPAGDNVKFNIKDLMSDESASAEYFGDVEYNEQMEIVFTKENGEIILKNVISDTLSGIDEIVLNYETDKTIDTIKYYK